MAHHVVWYPDESTYLRFYEICTDKSKFGPSYDAWKLAAQQKIDDAQRQGITLIKINIDPDAFLAWCDANSYVRNGIARSKFAGVTYFNQSS